MIFKSLQIDEVMAEGYRPSTEDILRTRIVTSGIFEINFTIGVSTSKLISASPREENQVLDLLHIECLPMNQQLKTKYVVTVTTVDL